MKNNPITKHPIVSGTLGTVLGGFILELTDLVEVLDGLILVLEPIGNFFVDSFSIQVWFFILLILTSSAIGAGVFYYFFAKLKKENKEVELEAYKKYKGDHILGIDWQWAWYGSRITDLIPLCPECAYQPHLNRRLINPRDSNTIVDCENCDFIKEWRMHPEKLKDRVIKEIERRIRTDEFKQVLDE